MTNLIRTGKLTLILTFFTLLTGARGCSFGTASYSYDTYPTPPPPTSGDVYVGGDIVPVPAAPAIYYGDTALTLYAPALSSITPDTTDFRVIVRAGSAFGPVVLESTLMPVDLNGVGMVDLLGLEYGFYDVEITGFDFLGNLVSHAATSLTVNEPLEVLTVTLDPVVFSGDVMLDLFAPYDGQFDPPMDSIDYVLWELDPVTGEYTLVEEMVELPFFSFDPTVIANLTLGTYLIDVYAYDAFGYLLFQGSTSFTHNNALTMVPVDLMYP